MRDGLLCVVRVSEDGGLVGWFKSFFINVGEYHQNIHDSCKAAYNSAGAKQPRKNKGHQKPPILKIQVADFNTHFCNPPIFIKWTKISNIT